MASTVTPLRYPGGKSRLLGYFKLLMEVNNLTESHYAEPFVGGAGLAIALLRHGYARFIHINDLDPSIYAFWRAVIEDTDELCKRIEAAKLTLSEWDRQKKIFSQGVENELIDLAFATFYLNRTNRSGIIRGGAIGGRQQDGKWKIDARFNKESLVSRIRQISLYRTRINLHNLSAESFIDTIIPDIPDKKITYFDPPYYARAHRLYMSDLVHEDHVRIARKIQGAQTPWVLTYDCHEAIEREYANRRLRSFDLRYTANQARIEGKEVMIFSDDLVLPEVETPVGIVGREFREQLQAARYAAWQ